VDVQLLQLRVALAELAPRRNTPVLTLLIGTDSAMNRDGHGLTLFRLPRHESLCCAQKPSRRPWIRGDLAFAPERS
jgi:hypothetical protein